MKKKTALILSGWGMRAVFCVGALLALQKELWFTAPDIVIAGSWSVWTASYFIARQYKDIKTIWLSHLSTKRFINFWRVWKIMDIDYLIDVVFKKQAPLYVKKIYDSPIRYYIGATNAHSGKVEYFSQKDGIDIFELMRASKAMPFFYGRSVDINWSLYHDGSNSSAVELHIQKALDLGADKIVVLNSHTKFSHWIIDLWLFFKSHIFKKWMMEEYHERDILAKKFRKNKNIFFCSASNRWPSALDNKQSVLKANFLAGYNQIVKKKWEIKKFLA